jgi:hypothetical protein
MKRLATLILMALILPLVSMGQSKAVVDFQNKYSDDRDASFVTIQGSLFNFVASIADFDDDPEAQALGRIADGIEAMQVLSVPYFEADLSKAEVQDLKASLKKENYESLMSAKDGREYVEVMAKGSGSEIRDIIILVDNRDQFVLISMDGVLSMEDISYLSKNHKNWH